MSWAITASHLGKRHGGCVAKEALQWGKVAVNEERLQSSAAGTPVEWGEGRTVQES